jgi:hypothetical protein
MKSTDTPRRIAPDFYQGKCSIFHYGMRSMLRQFAGLSFVLAVSATFLAGCTAEPTGTAVSGTVSYHNKPVTGGELTFHYPDKAVFNIAVKPDGSFATSGVPAGNVKVTVNTEKLKGMTTGQGAAPVKDAKGQKPPMAGTQGEMGSPVYVRIPPQYSDPGKTPLSWELKLPTEKKDFVLTD